MMKIKKILTNIKVQVLEDSRRWWFWCCVDKLTAITNDNYEKQLQSLYDEDDNLVYTIILVY